MLKSPHRAVDVIREAGDFEDCPQPVYDVLSIVLATNEHRSLNQYKFRCIFAKKITHSKGRRTLATIKRLSPKENLLSGVDVLITIDFYFWTENPEKQEALLFHELCHLMISEEGDLTTVGHDLEEFYAVIKRYGDWNHDVKPFADALQGELFEVATLR